MSRMEDSVVDVLVVGAGPGGSAAAYYLARAGLRVLLLDKAEFPRDKTCGDGLSPRALAALDDMGLLPAVMQAGCRINGVEIYGPDGRSIAAPIPGQDGRPGYMLVVPRRVLDGLLLEHARAQGAAFMPRIHVTDAQSTADGVTVRGARDGQAVAFNARAAVIATGAASGLLVRMGVLAQAPPGMLAARTYYEDLDVLHDRVQLRFDGVPLPGYAWVFPTGQRSANVGAGFLAGRSRHTPRQAFDAFAGRTRLKAVLGRARRAGPVKGYPLRVDFAAAPTHAGRALLVGEAAGLVNPLSGEGIDYALESGRIAAQHLIAMFERADFSPAQFAAYDRALRERYLALFKFCARARDLALNPLVLPLLIRIAARRADLKLLLIRIVLGEQPIPRRITAWTVLRAMLHSRT